MLIFDLFNTNLEYIYLAEPKPLRELYPYVNPFGVLVNFVCKYASSIKLADSIGYLI